MGNFRSCSIMSPRPRLGRMRHVRIKNCKTKIQRQDRVVHQSRGESGNSRSARRGKISSTVGNLQVVQCARGCGRAESGALQRMRMWEKPTQRDLSEGTDATGKVSTRFVGSAVHLTVFLVWGGVRLPSARTALFSYDRS